MHGEHRDYNAPVDCTEYIAGHRERRAAERASNAGRALAARQAAERVAALLAREFSARRVVLFGSLASCRFGARSDIDLAVDGVDPARFFAASAAAQREA